MRSVRLILVPVLLVAFASMAFAQAGTMESTPKATAAKTGMKSPDEMAKEALAKWKTALKLTDEQTPQFETAMTESYQKMADAKKEAAGDKTKMKASLEQIMKDRKEALAKVLTPEQMKTYETESAKHVSAAKKHMSMKKSG